MQHFYTHVLRGDDYAEDREGQEFASLEEARESARQSARMMLAHEFEAGRNPKTLEYHIHDEAGARLAVVQVHATISGLDS
jgi:hypothetical protein